MKEMECPCSCEICGELFDLEDGYASERLKNSHGNIVICEECGEKEKAEIEREEEISELNQQIENAEYDIKHARKRLAELGVK